MFYKQSALDTTLTGMNISPSLIQIHMFSYPALDYRSGTCCPCATKISVWPITAMVKKRKNMNVMGSDRKESRVNSCASSLPATRGCGDFHNFSRRTSMHTPDP